jgi:hypothetical protein
MSVTGRVSFIAKAAALWAGTGMAALCIGLAGIGFLAAAGFIWLLTRFPPYGAAGIAGIALLLLALLTVVIGNGMIRRMKARQPSMLAEFGGTIGLAARIVGMMVRKDPRKAIILSMIAGALAEYVTSDRKK